MSMLLVETDDTHVKVSCRIIGHNSKAIDQTDHPCTTLLMMPILRMMRMIIIFKSPGLMIVPTHCWLSLRTSDEDDDDDEEERTAFQVFSSRSSHDNDNARYLI